MPYSIVLQIYHAVTGLKKNMNKLYCISELKQCAIDVLYSLQQNVIYVAIDEWKKRLKPFMHADGQRFEHLSSD